MPTPTVVTSPETDAAERGVGGRAVVRFPRMSAFKLGQGRTGSADGPLPWHMSLSRDLWASPSTSETFWKFETLFYTFNFLISFKISTCKILLSKFDKAFTFLRIQIVIQVLFVS